MSDTDDEDLRRAIAISLADPNQGYPTTSRVIRVDCDDEDASATAQVEQEARADAGRSPGSHKGSHTRVDRHEGTGSVKKLGILGLDRKQMEAARLARKRHSSISPPPTRKITKLSHPKLDSPQFLQGAVKKTWAFGHSRAGDDIKLEEVLQRDDLQLAVLSSFQWDIPWLLAKIDLSTKLTLIMQAKEETVRKQYIRETAGMTNLRLCFPSMEGQINCMHSKLMLLSHPGYLRIVVPTANLVNYDWGETGEMENMVFLIDLPRLPDGKRNAKEDLTFFGQELLYFLTANGLDHHIVDSLCSFDFTATHGYAFIHTIGGAHGGVSWRQTGYTGLGIAVQNLGLATKKNLSIDFITSSVGSLTMDFISSIYKACQGDDGLADYKIRNLGGKNSSKTMGKADQEKTEEAINQNFRIHFPTHETVTASTAGGAGTICIQPKYYESPKFPRQLMRDCKSVRQGLLMHNKILYVRPEGGGQAWAYVGSANCSESAWGNRLVKDRVVKGPKLNCRNWECGVLIPISRSGKGEGLEALFGGVVPVPVQEPGEKYGSRKPWYFMEQG